MVAVSRWNEYSVDATTNNTDETHTVLQHNRAFTIGTGSAVGDAISIPSGNHRIGVNMGAEAFDIILASGTNLDPRFVALDVQRKVQAKADVAASGTESEWEFATCKFLNGEFYLWSGDANTPATVHVQAPSAGSDARTLLGWDTETASAGTSKSNTYLGGGGTVSVGGTYKGLYDDEYVVICTNFANVGTPAVIGAEHSFTGTITAAGPWSYSEDEVYTITINTANGSIMGGGTGNVPRITNVTSDWSDDDSSTVELLYPDYWYKIGSRGLQVKFSDGVFDGGPDDVLTIQISCTDTQEDAGGGASTGTVGTNAKFIVRSKRGDDYLNGTPTTPVFLNDSQSYEIGTRGLTINFVDNQTIAAGDRFTVIGRAVRPSSGDAGVTQINYGNVTVSTESPVKVVQFELMSGAVLLNDCKFGLYDHGTFQHHYANDSDTLMHFGTVGAGHPSPDDGDEWTTGVSATDINSNKVGGSTGTPESMWHTAANLAVVNSADDSEAVGNEGLISDPIWLGIKVGASETGATTVTYRMFFDFS